MSRPIRPTRRHAEFNLCSAEFYLKGALECARFADCPRLVAKINSALKSLGGARRHLQHRIQRAQRT